MFRLLCRVFALTCIFTQGLSAEDKPNILYILADDLGYGDVQILNPKRGKIPTPHLDRLATQGMVFTDAHSGSSVCTPTRYGILTGRYSWRTSLVSGVLGGLGAPLIAPDRLTVAAMLRDQGYRTACIGKWHLGLEWAKWEDPEARKKRPIDPVWLCAALSEAMPDDAIYVEETTTHRGVVQRHLEWNEPGGDALPLRHLTPAAGVSGRAVRGISSRG